MAASVTINGVTIPIYKWVDGSYVTEVGGITRPVTGLSANQIQGTPDYSPLTGMNGPARGGTTGGAMSLQDLIQQQSVYNQQSSGVNNGGQSTTTPTTIPTTTSATDPNALSKSGQYYKVGNDVYDAQGNHIDLATFQKLGLNFSLLPEKSQTSTAGTQTGIQTGGTIDPNSVSGVYAQGNDVYAVINGTPTHIDQNQFQSLGLNFSFLKQGTPVSLTEGQTGNPQVISSATQFDPSAYGISSDLWGQLDPATKAFVESTASLLKSQYDQGMTNASVNADLLNKAMAAAQTDPNIIAKYGDAAKIGADALSKNLSLVSAEYAQTQSEQATLFAQQKKDIADAAAAAGQTYSGFREQAKAKLEQQQSGVIASTKRDIQSRLDTLGRTFESTFGSAALANVPQITAGDIAYAPVGGITGTAPIAQKEDILAKGQATYQAEKL